MTSSCVVQLSRADLVKGVMRAKRALANNYLNTKDINPELLGQFSSVCMPAHKIYINESLPHDKFQLFKNLKPIAQGLGFKYVWHAGGRFLARHKGGERAHVFASAADLQAIRTACRSVRHLFDALENGKNIWKEMRNLDLLPKRKGGEFHGFTPGELNEHFARISASSLENLEDATDTILADSKGSRRGS